MTSGKQHKKQVAQELADTVTTVLGSLDGQRITHHKGVVLEGTFTATPRAAELTRAAHFNGDAVRVTVRFSNGFPSTDDLDITPGDPRGMAVKFYLDGGQTTDLICQDWPVFPAATPEQFRDLLLAQHEGEELVDDRVQLAQRLQAGKRRWRRPVRTLAIRSRTWGAAAH